MADLEIKGLQIYTPAYNLGYLGGFHPSEIVMICFDNERLADKVISEAVDSCIYRITFFFDCRPVEGLGGELLRPESYWLAYFLAIDDFYLEKHYTNTIITCVRAEYPLESVVRVVKSASFL